ncbi:MAG: hypothetical protein KJ621_10710 [Proteobacteria bacterium]|nr:hypothetical protein [Pseudomonadota bacterium]MBU1743150.1 hypothetical protein [Pseudomonadota bacterium]
MTEGMIPTPERRSPRSRMLLYILLGVAVIWIFYQYMSPGQNLLQVTRLRSPAGTRLGAAGVVDMSKGRLVVMVKLLKPAPSDLRVQVFEPPRPLAGGISAARDRQARQAELARGLLAGVVSYVPFVVTETKVVAAGTLPKGKDSLQFDLPQGFKPRVGGLVRLIAADRPWASGVFRTPEEARRQK